MITELGTLLNELYESIDNKDAEFLQAERDFSDAKYVASKATLACDYWKKQRKGKSAADWRIVCIQAETLLVPETEDIQVRRSRTCLISSC